MIDISRYVFSEGATKNPENGEKTGYKIVALATYAGRPVRGVAKLHPNDENSRSDGMMLAAARCNEKISKKRLQRAKRKYKEASEQLAAAQRYFHKMCRYYEDSHTAVKTAEKELEDILKDM